MSGTLLSFPDVVAIEKNRSGLLALITSRLRCFFPSNCSRSFLLSFNSVIFLLKNSREKERERERERAINILLSLLATSRVPLPLSFSVLFVVLIIYYDMIGERLILLLYRKVIFLRLLISYALSIYLIPIHRPFYYYSLKNSFSSWQYHLSSKRMCTKGSEREREKRKERKSVMNYLVSSSSKKRERERDVLVLVQHVFSCRRQQIDMKRKMLVWKNKSNDSISTPFITRKMWENIPPLHSSLPIIIFT